LSAWLNQWSRHQGRAARAGFKSLLGMDVWEHAFMRDYTAPERAQSYIERFLRKRGLAQGVERRIKERAAIRPAADEPTGHGVRGPPALPGGGARGRQFLPACFALARPRLMSLSKFVRPGPARCRAGEVARSLAHLRPVFIFLTTTRHLGSCEATGSCSTGAARASAFDTYEGRSTSAVDVETSGQQGRRRRGGRVEGARKVKY